MDDQGLKISGSFGRDGEHCQSYRMLLLKRALGIYISSKYFQTFSPAEEFFLQTRPTQNPNLLNRRKEQIWFCWGGDRRLQGAAWEGSGTEPQSSGLQLRTTDMAKSVHFVVRETGSGVGVTFPRLLTSYPVCFLHYCLFPTFFFFLHFALRNQILYINCPTKTYV